jgi:hypothetical protein
VPLAGPSLNIAVYCTFQNAFVLGAHRNDTGSENVLLSEHGGRTMESVALRVWIFVGLHAGLILGVLTFF